MGLTRTEKRLRRDHALIGMLRALAKEKPVENLRIPVLPLTMYEAANRLEELTGGPPAPIGAKWKEGRGR